jgi:tRNA threonylcarbamoyladenosine biosynthesis protein TsaE
MPGHHVLKDARETHALGKSFGADLGAPVVIYLEGDLGAGKTTFAQGLINGLGCDAAVVSPTYTLVEEYVTDRGRVHHLDLYRIAGPEEVESLGLRDRCGPSDIVLIEWPDRGGHALPLPNWRVSLAYRDTGRAACILKP